MTDARPQVTFHKGYYLIHTDVVDASIHKQIADRENASHDEGRDEKHDD